MGGKGSGGARIGAGRKPLDGIPRIKLSVRIPVELMNELERDAEHLNVPLSKIVVELLEKGLEQ